MKATEPIVIFDAKFCIRCGIPSDNSATAWTTKFDFFRFAVCSNCLEAPSLQPPADYEKQPVGFVAGNLLSFWDARNEN